MPPTLQFVSGGQYKAAWATGTSDYVLVPFFFGLSTHNGYQKQVRDARKGVSTHPEQAPVVSTSPDS